MVVLTIIGIILVFKLVFKVIDYLDKKIRRCLSVGGY
jgi:hypothetical protein